MAHMSSWVDFYRYWLEWFTGSTHIIYYSNLKLDPYSELKAAINFLGVKLDDTRLNCTVEFPHPAYFKRPAVDPPVQKAKLFGLSISKADKAIRMFKKMVLNKFGEKSDIYKRFNLEFSVKKI